LLDFFRGGVYGRLVNEIGPGDSLELPRGRGKERTDLPMQNQPIGPDAGPTCDETERVVLSLLLDSEASGPWSVQELARETGSELRVAVALLGLHGAGLVHRSQEFVWATRAATRFSQLADGL
jgi:hypothetical protein